jgi:lipase
MRDISVEVPDGRINVWHRLAGADGRVIVLLHGLSGTSRWWTRVIDHLPPEVGIAAVDVRGRGGSLEAPPPFDLVTIADDVARTLNRLEVDRAIVAGYSMGAWVAAIFGRRHADRAERLILLDGGLPLSSAPGAAGDEVIEAAVGPALARLEMSFASEEEFFEHWRGHPALVRHWDDSMRAALAYELRPTDGGFRVLANPEAIRVGARQITVDGETNAAAEGVEVPTLLIIVEKGTADQDGGMIPLESARAAAATNPMLAMEYLAGLNHYTLVLGAGASAVASAIAEG